MVEAAPATAGSPVTFDRRLGRWLQPVADRVRREPVLATAVVLIIAGIAWRAYVAAGGFLALDDYRAAQWALEDGLTPGYLFMVWNDHLSPWANAIFWIFTRLTGLAYWPYLIVMLVFQAAGAFVFLRVLRQLLRPGWALLIPLAVFQFCPLTLESTSQVSTGIRLAPMQLAIVWALSAQISYVGTRERRHLVSLALAFFFGLGFTETMVLVAPMLVLFTAGLYVSGGPVHRLWEALRRYWPAWVTLATLCVIWIFLYFDRAHATGRDVGMPGPRSVGEVTGFLEAYFNRLLVPGLFGGPVSWDFNASVVGPDAPGFASPAPVVSWLSWAVLVGLVVFAIARRPGAAWLWAMVAVYAGVEVSLLAANRLGTSMSQALGQAPRYAADVVVIAALSIGLTVAGRQGDDETRPAPRWARSRPVAVLGVLALVGGAVACVVSGVRYAEGWSHKLGRDYIHTAQAEVAAAPPGTVFFDRLVPTTVVFTFDAPERRQSSILAADKGPQPAFVTEGEHVSVIADDGHVRPAWVAGRAALPGPTECGWPVSGGAPLTIPLEGFVEHAWAQRILYTSPVDTIATVRLGNASRDFPVRRGSHQYFLLTGNATDPYSWAAGQSVELSLREPTASFCVSELVVGEPVAAP